MIYQVKIFMKFTPIFFGLFVLLIFSEICGGENTVEKKLSANTNTTIQKTSSDLISLNFQNIQVRSVLQLLGEFSHKNIIISNGVIGDITLNLTNVSWDQAMDVILKTRNLSKRELGAVIIIAPAAEMAQIETQDLNNQAKLAELVPLYNETFEIKYGNAQDYYDMLRGNLGGKATDSKGLMSKRGRVILDKRTNSLFIDDTQAQLNIIRDFLAKADVPVKQVIIEARLVSVSKTFEQNIGVNFKVSKSGNITNSGGFNMDLGGGVTGTGYSNLELQFGRLPKNFLLDLELSALESENDADIRSSPRVIVANNHRATIEQGTQVPYITQAASGGTTTQFVTAVLKLDVTPQITPDGKIILQLVVTQDMPKKIDNTTVIDTKKVDTNILVENGETIVLGGIYEKLKSNKQNRVPFLSSIPVIGNLFKSNSVTDDRRELLIFVTPKIVGVDVK